MLGSHGDAAETRTGAPGLTGETTMPDKGKSGPKGKGGTKPPPGKKGKGKG
jgi:hypothetical protein